MAIRSARPDARPLGGGPDPNELSSAAAAGASAKDKRVAPRFQLEIPVKMFRKGQDGQGFVQDISASGARIERATIKPTEGSRLRIEMSLFKESARMPLYGEVVRHTDSGGFCVRFVNMDPRMQRVLRVLLPKVADERVDGDNEFSTFSGNLEVHLGRELHARVAECARGFGVSVDEWLRSKIGAQVEESLVELRHLEQSGHDPSTCPDCLRKNRTGR